MNKGKGYALKTAFEYIKSLGNECVIVTADSDGQHSPVDIKRVYDSILQHGDSVVLGSRLFEGDVPLKSRIGNMVSNVLARAIFARQLTDTQTGLRAFGSNLLDLMISIKGNRYEYEMNMISEVLNRNIPIYEIAIKTIYINENKESHFRPVQDFSRNTFSQLKYVIPALIYLIINIAMFFVTDSILVKHGSESFYAVLFASFFIGWACALVASLAFEGCYILMGKLPGFNIARLARRLFYMIIELAFIVLLGLAFKNSLDKFVEMKALSVTLLVVCVPVLNYYSSKKSELHR